MSTESTIRKFLVTMFQHLGATHDLGADVALIDQGILDSTSVFEVRDFLEQELGIQVEDDDMVPNNFGSIAKLVAFVEGKKGN
jgi:acyl carrier protein